MTHRSLLIHCKQLLSRHHAFAKGTFKKGAAAVHDSGLGGLDGTEFEDNGPSLYEPIIHDEQDILRTYLHENNVSITIHSPIFPSCI